MNAATKTAPTYSHGFHGSTGVTIVTSRGEDALPTSWQLVNHAWGRMPAGYHLGRDLVKGLTADECLAIEAEKLEAFADRLRELFAMHAVDTAELGRFRAMLDAEIDRADMIAARRATRETRK